MAAIEISSLSFSRAVRFIALLLQVFPPGLTP
jgi:hypothetical protein